MPQKPKMMPVDSRPLITDGPHSLGQRLEPLPYLTDDGTKQYRATIDSDNVGGEASVNVGKLGTGMSAAEQAAGRRAFNEAFKAKHGRYPRSEK